MRRRTRFAAVAVSAAAAFAAGGARGEPVQLHLAGGGAEAIGAPQGHEYGLGAAGRAAVELPLTHAIGYELAVGGVWLPHTSPPTDPALAGRGDGAALTAMVGLRLRPFAEVAGPWADANAGYVRTGDLDRFGFELELGYDWRLDERGRWDFGPYAGYLHVIQPDDTLRPQDAHLFTFGIQVTLGAERRRRFVQAATAQEPPATLPMQLPPPPPPPSPPDRDGDGVSDGEDACPDVPGVGTDDSKTNGCPPAGDGVRVVRDRIEYDDAILFDTDRVHVDPASWPVLQKLARFIDANSGIAQVDITGHAEARDAREGDGDDPRLSRARAEAVKERLVHFGVNDGRLTTIGYGEGRAPGAGDARRAPAVELIITKVTNAQGGTTSLPQLQEAPP